MSYQRRQPNNQFHIAFASLLLKKEMHWQWTARLHQGLKPSGRGMTRYVGDMPIAPPNVLLALSGHPGIAREYPPSGRGGYRDFRASCLLLTQGGHRSPLFAVMHNSAASMW
jgi:hypothetical protein